jgi:hypothetical protein
LLKHKRLISIIATLAFCLSFLAPALLAPAPAVAAAGTISALRVPVVADKGNQELGTVKVTIPAGSIKQDDVVVFSLPNEWDTSDGNDFVGSAVYDETKATNGLWVPVDYQNTSSAEANKNGLQYDQFDVEDVDKNGFRIKALANQSMTNDLVFYVLLGSIDVEKGTKGDCEATFSGPNTGFPLGSVVVAKTSVGGKVSLSASGTDTANTTFDFDLTIKEDGPGSLENRKETLILTLPDGFEWTKTGTLKTMWGENITLTPTINDEELSFESDSATSKVSAWEITGLEFTVVDESIVDAGDIIVKVKGKSDVATTELTVGKYGDFGVSVKAENAPEVFAGQIKQEIGDFVIKENIKGSLVTDRYITLTLPSYAKWTKIDEIVQDGVKLEFVNTAGSNGNVLRYKIENNNQDAAELEFKDFEVALDVTAPGDLTVKVGGNAGVDGEVVVAKIALPVTMKAENATEVIIGAAAQKIGDIIITETVAGGINDEDGQDYIALKLPAGCEWAKIPTITVESGDLKLDLDQVTRAKLAQDYYQLIKIPIDRDSNEPSVIKLTDCYVTVDRTVPEGNMSVALVGPAVLISNVAWGQAFCDTQKIPHRYPLDPTKGEKGYQVGSEGMFPQTQAIAAAAVANVVTPSGSQGRSAVFYIGSTIMNVNGQNVIMDAAPYIKAGRTYVPVRYLGDALGATTEWDAATKTVTVTKGDNTVVLVIGSTIAKVNGADVQMDVAPEITGVGRTMLPARWVAEGLGYQVGWNAALQQVVIQ